MAEGGGKETDVRVTNGDELKAFLDSRPLGDVVNISLRSVWRILPLVRQTDNDLVFKRSMLAIFRTTLVAQRSRYATFENAAISASELVSNGEGAGTDRPSICVVQAAIGCASAAAHANSPYTSSYHTTASQFSASGPDAAAGITFQVARALYNDTLKLEHFWLNIECDCRTLVGQKDILGCRLWESEPGWFEVVSKKLFDELKTIGTPWNLVETWFRQLQIDASIDPFPNPVLAEIANERTRFWGDGKGNTRTPDIIMAEIAERLGWLPREVRLEGVTLEAVGKVTGGDAIVVEKEEPQFAEGTQASGATKGLIVQQIKSDPKSLEQLIEGLVTLVSAEEMKISGERPNSEAAKRVQESQISFLQKIHAGLLEIKKSLATDKPEQIEQKVEGFLHKISAWYGEQPDWTQKAVKATGIMTVAAPFVAGGFPAWLAVAVPTVFIAKDELGDLKDILRSSKD